MSTTAILKITDGTNTIDLLAEQAAGIHVVNWEPAIPDDKGGGIWRDSPIAEGRRIVGKFRANPIETMTISVNGDNADDLADRLIALRAMLEKASDYWVNRWSTTPIYLIARAAGETNTRYALLHYGRVGNEKNYFAGGFLQPQAVRVFDELPLTFERGQWTALPPTQRECIVPRLPVCRSFTPTASGDDAYVDFTGGTINTSGNDLLTGNQRYGFGVRFRNVTIPQGATILDAHLVLQASAAASGAGNCRTLIQGELNAYPAAFSTYADYNARTRATAEFNWDTTFAISTGDEVTSPEATYIVEEIVALAEWQSGNDLVLFVDQNKVSTVTRTFASVENGTYHPPILVVTWMSDEATCDDSDYDGKFILASKSNRCPVSGVYHYDLNITTWSDNKMIATSYPYNLNDAAVAVGDMFYFVVDTNAPEGGPFDNIVIPLDVTNVGDVTATVQYYNGSTWTSTGLLPDNYTSDFTETGVKSIHWRKPTDWTALDLGGLGGTGNPGITGYAVRLVVSAVGTGQITLASVPYTVTWPHVEVLGSQIPGELDAYMRMLWRYRFNYNDDADWFMVATRSVSRGEAFVPYLHATNIQLPDNLTTSAGTDGTFTATPTSATGIVLRCTFGTTTTLANRITYTLASTLASQYAGRYRMFLMTNAAPSGIEARIEVAVGAGTFYTEDHALNTGYTFHELGLLDISYIANELSPTAFALSVQLSGASTIDLYALILMPIDEWSSELSNGGAMVSGNVTNEKTLVVDSISNPRVAIEGAIRSSSGTSLYSYCLTKSVSYAALQTNAKQRLYLIARDSNDLHPGDAYSLGLDILRRYKGLRGSR